MNWTFYICHNVSNLRAHDVLFITIIRTEGLRRNVWIKVGKIGGGGRSVDDFPKTASSKFFYSSYRTTISQQLTTDTWLKSFCLKKLFFCLKNLINTGILISSFIFILVTKLQEWIKIRLKYTVYHNSSELSGKEPPAYVSIDNNLFYVMFYVMYHKLYSGWMKQLVKSSWYWVHD